MLRNRGELDGVRILSPKTVALLTSDQLKQIETPTIFMGPVGSYGLADAMECRPDFRPLAGRAAPIKETEQRHHEK